MITCNLSHCYNYKKYCFWNKIAQFMDIDNVGYSLADAVAFDSYLDFKPPEKAKATASAGPVNH